MEHRLVCIIPIFSAFCAVLIVLLWRSLFVRVRIFEYQKGLKYVRGRFSAILEPGYYWTYTGITTVTPVDVRLRSISVAGQEIVTKDGITLKMSLAVQYSVDDPHTAIDKVEDYQNSLYLLLQIALREHVCGQTADEVMEGRGTAGDGVKKTVEEKAKQMGLVLHSVSIKDITLPGDLKRVFAQTATARKEAQAVLEKARGETAALRNLLNAAQTLEKHPLLLQLRIIQALETSKGNTIVMGPPPPGMPHAMHPGMPPFPRPGPVGEEEGEERGRGI